MFRVKIHFNNSLDRTARTVPIADFADRRQALAFARAIDRSTYESIAVTVQFLPEEGDPERNFGLAYDSLEDRTS